LPNSQPDYLLIQKGLAISSVDWQQISVQEIPHKSEFIFRVTKIPSGLAKLTMRGN
jgi:hypothetical protein